MSTTPTDSLCNINPGQLKLGESSEEIIISGIEEIRNTALSLAEQARYNINIFTQDMDDAILNNDDFENYIFNLATRHPGNKVRILVLNSSSAVKKGHRLIRIAQKLTSSVFIKNPPDTYIKDKRAFITADGMGVLYRSKADTYNYEATVNFMSPLQVKKLDEFFNEVWQQSVRDPKVRRLCV